MDGFVERIFVVFTLFSGWSFRASSGKKRLKESKSASEPNTPTHPARSRSKSPSTRRKLDQTEAQGSPASTSQPIRIKSSKAERVRLTSSSSHSLPNSYRCTPESGPSSASRSSSSSQYSSLHDQIWQQAYMNSCR